MPLGVKDFVSLRKKGRRMGRRELGEKNATRVHPELARDPEFNLSSVFWEHRPSLRLSTSVRFENLNGSIRQGEKYLKNSSVIKLKDDRQNESY